MPNDKSFLMLAGKELSLKTAVDEAAKIFKEHLYFRIICGAERI